MTHQSYKIGSVYKIPFRKSGHILYIYCILYGQIKVVVYVPQIEKNYT